MDRHPAATLRLRVAGGEPRGEALGVAGQAVQAVGVEHHDVGARLSGDVEPEVPRPAELEAQHVVVRRRPTHQHRHAIRRLEASRQGVFLAKSDNGTCMSCFVRVRPQVFQEVKTASAVHTCDSCRRFLYYEPALKPAADAAPAEAPAVEPAADVPAPDVQAADGQSL